MKPLSKSAAIRAADAAVYIDPCLNGREWYVYTPQSFADPTGPKTRSQPMSLRNASFERMHAVATLAVCMIRGCADTKAVEVASRDVLRPMNGGRDVLRDLVDRATQGGSE